MKRFWSDKDGLTAVGYMGLLFLLLVIGAGIAALQGLVGSVENVVQ